MAHPLAVALDAVLPQTQCTRCGYAGCAPYAEAIARGEVDINRCPPGGDDTIAALAQLTGRPTRPLDPACGETAPLVVALIDEARCIGCTLCIAACPVDAIIGGPKRMHAVLPSLCSGCELCVAPCPVDCIALVPAARAWTADDAAAARERHRARNARLARAERIADRARASTETTVAPQDAPATGTPRDDNAAARKAAIDAALARARARRQARAA